MAIWSSGIGSVAATEARTRPLAHRRNRLIAFLTFVLLLGVLVAELMLSIHHESQTWDEACHIFAGYSYWTHGDFAINPEHPPLVKLLATLPLLGLPLRVPDHPEVFSKEADFLTGTDFVYKNNADQILTRTRIAVATLTLLLAISLFHATRKIFGTWAALTALFLFVFEPNILAHGITVTTDIGLSLFLFATVYSFYRYVDKRSLGNFALTAFSAGLALATKHSGILVFPILILLAAYELIRARPGTRVRNLLQLSLAIVGIAVAAGLILWSFYGFRLPPRAGIDAQANVLEYASRLHHPFQASMISAFAKWHLLPQSYLYGLADVGITAEFSHSYLLGRTYPHGVWFYFPVAFVIKSTLTLLLLLIFVPFVALIRPEYRREVAFMLIPCVTFFLVAMTSGMNIGIRHVLPIFPFLLALCGWAAWTVIEHSRKWGYVIGFLLFYMAVSSIHSYPAYLAYSNELWGGPAATHKYLSDSNADWGQQLKATKYYLDNRHVDHCWFAYFADVVVDTSYYGIPCKPLTTIASLWLQPTIDVPATVDGPVLLSAGVLSGYEFGPSTLNPYDQFKRVKPSAVIEDAVFVFDGKFDIPLAAALNHVTRAQLLEKNNHLDEALAHAQQGVALAPEAVQTQAELGEILKRLNRKEESHAAFERALHAAETIHPEFSAGWIPGLQVALENRQH